MIYGQAFTHLAWMVLNVKQHCNERRNYTINVK